MKSELDFSHEFNAFAEKANNALLSADPIQILRVGVDTRPSDIALLLKIVSNGANVYAIWGKDNHVKKWIPLYVGQRKEKDIKSRLCQHFFKVHPQTESKLKKVIAYVEDGGKIGVTAISVKPDELRTSVEQYIIKKNLNNKTGFLSWNKHS